MAYIQKNKTFRNLILKFYNKKCSITEEVQISNLQDIHIILDKSSIPENVYYNTFNGILMKRTLYENEFCTYKFTFDYENYELINNSFVKIGIIIQSNSLNLEINKYKYKKIKVPYKTLYFIRHHYLIFLEKNNIQSPDISNINIYSILNGNVYDKCGDIVMLLN